MANNDKKVSKSPAKSLTIIHNLLKVMEAAIENGDWKVDGRCDPEVEMIRAKKFLEARGVSTQEQEGLALMA